MEQTALGSRDRELPWSTLQAWEDKSLERDRSSMDRKKKWCKKNKEMQHMPQTGHHCHGVMVTVDRSRGGSVNSSSSLMPYSMYRVSTAHRCCQCSLLNTLGGKHSAYQEVESYQRWGLEVVSPLSGKSYFEPLQSPRGGEVFWEAWKRRPWGKAAGSCFPSES